MSCAGRTGPCAIILGGLALVAVVGAAVCGRRRRSSDAVQGRRQRRGPRAAAAQRRRRQRAAGRRHDRAALGLRATTTCATAQALLRAGANVKAANRYGMTPLALAAQNGSAADARAAAARPVPTPTPACPRRRDAADDGGAHRQRAGDQGAGGARRRRRTRTRSVDGRDGAHVGGGREPRRRRARRCSSWARTSTRSRRRCQFPEFKWIDVGHGQHGAAARRLDAADARRAAGGARRRAGRWPTAAPDLNLNVAIRTARRRWSVAIINAHYDLAAMLLEKGADPNVADSHRARRRSTRWWT